jgi:hypothetical protein
MGTERQMTERDRYTSDYDTIEQGGRAGPCLLPPTVVAGGTWYTTAVDMQGYEKVVFDICGGVAIGGPDTTLAIRVLQSATPQPLNAIAVGAKVLAGIHGSKFISDSILGDYSYVGYYGYYYGMNRKWLIEVDVEEMDVDNMFRYLQLEYIVSAQDTWLLSIEAIRSLASYEACPQTGADEVVA